MQAKLVQWEQEIQHKLHNHENTVNEKIAYFEQKIETHSKALKRVIHPKANTNPLPFDHETRIDHLEKLVSDLVGRLSKQEEKNRDLEEIVEQLNEVPTQGTRSGTVTPAQIKKLQEEITELTATKLPEM